MVSVNVSVTWVPFINGVPESCGIYYGWSFCYGFFVWGMMDSLSRFKAALSKQFSFKKICGLIAPNGTWRIHGYFFNVPWFSRAVRGGWPFNEAYKANQSIHPFSTHPFYKSLDLYTFYFKTITHHHHQRKHQRLFYS